MSEVGTIELTSATNSEVFDVLKDADIKSCGDTFIENIKIKQTGDNKVEISYQKYGQSSCYVALKYSAVWE